MSTTIPGKIIEINENIATLDYGNEKIKVKMPNKNFKIDDHVLVNKNTITKKVPKKQTKEWLKILKDIEERKK